MTRRRKRTERQIAYAFLFGPPVLLTIVAIFNPLAVLSLIFILILICLCVAGAFLLWGGVDKKIVIKTERAKRYRYAQHLRSKGELGFMTPLEFERYVATLYENLGYIATVTKQSGDGGIDIILENKEEKAAVQVKRYTKGNVGRPEVQRLVGASLNQFDKMFFVTTSGYTNEAREYAEKHNVGLVDADMLAAMSSKVFGPNYKDKVLSKTILGRTSS